MKIFLIYSLSYAFHAATFLTETPLDPYFSRIEDCVAQADEVDGKYLQVKTEKMFSK